MTFQQSLTTLQNSISLAIKNNIDLNKNLDKEKALYISISLAIILGSWWLTSGTLFHEAILPSPPDVAEGFWK